RDDRGGGAGGSAGGIPLPRGLPGCRAGWPGALRHSLAALFDAPLDGSPESGIVTGWPCIGDWTATPHPMGQVHRPRPELHSPSIAAATSLAAASGIAVAARSSTSSRAPG